VLIHLWMVMAFILGPLSSSLNASLCDCADRVSPRYVGLELASIR